MKQVRITKRGRNRRTKAGQKGGNGGRSCLKTLHPKNQRRCTGWMDDLLSKNEEGIHSKTFPPPIKGKPRETIELLFIPAMRQVQDPTTGEVVHSV